MFRSRILLLFVFLYVGIGSRLKDLMIIGSFTRVWSNNKILKAWFVKKMDARVWRTGISTMMQFESRKTQKMKVVYLFNRIPMQLESPHSEVGRKSYSQNTENWRNKHKISKTAPTTPWCGADHTGGAGISYFPDFWRHINRCFDLGFWISFVMFS